MKATLRFLFLLALCAFGTAAAHAATVALSFKDNADNEDGFRIERATGATGGTFAQLGADLPASPGTGLTVATNDTTAATGTVYRYRVLAFNTAGNSPFSNTATATVPQVAPGAPSELVVGTITVAIDDTGNVRAVATIKTPHETKSTSVTARIEKRTRGVKALWEWAVPARTIAAAPVTLAAADR